MLGVVCKGRVPRACWGLVAAQCPWCPAQAIGYSKPPPPPSKGRTLELNLGGLTMSGPMHKQGCEHWAWENSYKSKTIDPDSKVRNYCPCHVKIEKYAKKLWLRRVCFYMLKAWLAQLRC